MQIFDILLKYILWYDFLNNLDAQSDFDKDFVSRKPVKKKYSYLNYALDGASWNSFLFWC